MAKKAKVVFVCSNCGEDFPKWLGKCSSCGTWDSLKEFKESKVIKSKGSSPQSRAIISESKSMLLSDCTPDNVTRKLTGFPEVDRVLGGGMVPGAAVLIGGSPGVGKSTLMLHIAAHFTNMKFKVLYVSGEESVSQISVRSKRMRIQDVPVHILSETSVERILEITVELSPEVIVIDSIQTLFSENLDSAPGSVSQVRDVTAILLRYTKEHNIALYIVGHVTKDGSIAGPRVLEHMVDTVLYFEGDSDYNYRMLRAVKNRFGPAGEIALLNMSDKGLNEVTNASEFFLMNRDASRSGTTFVPVLEGSRVLVIELQALVNPSHFGMPQRVVSGVNHKKVALLTAVLERYSGIVLGDHDIFFNITGGLTINEPALDTGIAAALISSFRNIPVRDGLGFTGEIGLGGEIRPVNNMALRIKELESIGFTECVVSGIEKNPKWMTQNYSIKLIPCKTVDEMTNLIFD